MNWTERLRDAHPAVSDLREKARRRIPFFAWEYLECGTGREEACARNGSALSRRCFIPRFLKGEFKPETQIELFGRTYVAPIGVAPVGMTSLMWPGGEAMLAGMAGEMSLPYCLSTVGAETPETIGPLANGNGWFQLYPTRREDIRDSLINRAKQSGFSVLVLTVDVPVPSIRERQKRAGLTVPPKMTPLFWWRILKRPEWAIVSLRRGRPRFLTLEKYASAKEMQNQSRFFERELGGTLDWNYFDEVRKKWDGPLVLKGILGPEDAELAIAHGADGVWVSNHGGRQFDGAPAAIDCVRDIKNVVGDKAKILFDSGIRSGLDIVRALREGADFTFAGRPFVYGVAALGSGGARHTAHLLITDLKNAMTQLGCRDLREIVSVEASPSAEAIGRH